MDGSMYYKIVVVRHTTFVIATMHHLAFNVVHFIWNSIVIYHVVIVSRDTMAIPPEVVMPQGHLYLESSCSGCFLKDTKEVWLL